MQLLAVMEQVAQEMLHALQVCVDASAKVPAGQAAAATQLLPERKDSEAPVAVQAEQTDKELQTVHLGSQVVQLRVLVSP